MTASKGFGQLFSTLAVIIAVGLISTSVTYAALQSPVATLANNTINIGAADLRIGPNGTTFTVPSIAGFTFDGVVPGAPAVPANGDTFYLKNFGTASLILKASISTTPTNLGNVNLSKVYLDFTRVDIPEPEVSLSLQSLISANSSGGLTLGDTLAANSVAQYSLRVNMDSDAYSGTGVGVSISGINLAFVGSGISMKRHLRIAFVTLLLAVAVLMSAAIILFQAEHLSIYSPHLAQAKFGVSQNDLALVRNNHPLYVWTIPKAGYILNGLHQTKNLVGFVYAPTMLIALYEIRRLARHRRYEARQTVHGQSL